MFTCATSSTAVGTVTSSMEATAHATVNGLVCPSPRATLSTNNIPRRLSAATCVQRKQRPTRVVHWPRMQRRHRSSSPPQPRLQQTSPKAVRTQQHLQQHPRSLRGTTSTKAKRLPWPSCGLIRGGRPGLPLVRSDSPTTVPASRDSRSPLPSLLRKRPCSQKRHTLWQSCDLRFRSPFSHPPQPSAQVFMQKR